MNYFLKDGIIVVTRNWRVFFFFIKTFLTNEMCVYFYITQIDKLSNRKNSSDFDIDDIAYHKCRGTANVLFQRDDTQTNGSKCTKDTARTMFSIDFKQPHLQA